MNLVSKLLQKLKKNKQLDLQVGDVIKLTEVVIIKNHMVRCNCELNDKPKVIISIADPPKESLNTVSNAYYLDNGGMIYIDYSYLKYLGISDTNIFRYDNIISPTLYNVKVRVLKRASSNR